MPDEVRLFSMLGSWLYGSLIHATGVIGRTFEADVSAIRVFGVKDHEHSSFVDTARLGLNTRQDVTAQAWANDPDSLFELIRESGRQQGIFRPEVLFDPPASPAESDIDKSSRTDTLELAKDAGPGSSVPQQADNKDEHNARLDDRTLKLLEGLGNQIQVRDCLCLSMRVYGEIWAAVVLMRVKESQPFEPEHIKTLKQIKPAVAHMLRSGCARQGLTITPRESSKTKSTAKHLSTDQIIAKLTRMECQVLGYLRLATTEREISKEIHRSPHTVHVHVKNIYRKLDVNSRSELLGLFGDTLRD